MYSLVCHIKHVLTHLYQTFVAAGNRHLTCNIVVEPDGLRAAKVTAYRLLHKAQNPPVLLAAGIIEDRLVNENGEWKFAVRNFIM
jgi:hypothetical protein